MASFDTINYSITPNKAIQRQIVFDCLEIVDRHLPLLDAAYIGFGSIWFSDFVIAHKKLGVSNLISIENNPIGAKRARFNAPFRTISVEEGDSTPVLSDLSKNEKLLKRPWIVWLDYDRSVTDTTLNDIELIVTHAPPNSVFVVTIDAGGLSMSATKREKYLRELLGDAVPDDLEDDAFEVENMPKLLAKCMLDYVSAQAANGSRPGGFIPAFAIPYKDNAQMLTFGGILPAAAARGAAKACVESNSWAGFPSVPVHAPPLTMKEVQALQKLLPNSKGVSRTKLQKLGFDLRDDQLEAYVEHYRRYPTFLQVVA